MSEERRKAARIKKQLFIQYGYKINEYQKSWDLSSLKDISESGMCITTNKDFPVSEVLHFKMKLPSDPSFLFEFEGRVVAAKKLLQDTYLTRVEFIGLGEKQKEIIQAYVKNYLGKVKYDGPERRKGLRISNNFVVSYRILEEKDNVDISQTKNLGLGGMLLTTNRQLVPGTDLALEIRLPATPGPIKIVGEVVDSREVIKGLIYDTRIEFLTVDEDHLKIIKATIDYYLKKG